MADDIGQISLNLDTSEPFFKKKAKADKVVGNRRSRIKQRREIKSQKKYDQAAEKSSPQKPTTTNVDTSSTQKPTRGSKRKLNDGKQDPSAGHNHKLSGGKQRKTDGIISSLFHANPEIPVVESSKVDVITEGVFAGKTFKELPLHPYLISTLEEKLGFTELTQIQQKAIPILLNRQDALVKSQTGSGKTLAYAVPIIQSIQAFPTKTRREDGPYALIILPTRELVIQTFDIFSKILRTFIWIVPGCLMGGEKKKAEKSRLRKGVNILITTPGRLLDHLNTTRTLSLSRVHWLVIDEADRLLELGYERDVAQILNYLNTQSPSHNTVLLSATLSEGVERLSSITLRDPKHISIHSSDEDLIPRRPKARLLPPSNSTTLTDMDTDTMTVNGNGGKDGGEDKVGWGTVDVSSNSKENFSVPSQLNQHFIITPCKLRLVMLASWILWKCRHSATSSKMVVFMSTQDAVEFHWQLFNKILNRHHDPKKNFGARTVTGQALFTTEQDGNKAKAGRGKKEGGEGGDAATGAGGNKRQPNIPDIPFYHLHGEMMQKERTDTFRLFAQASSGVLLCTDVAARGLDLPRVDWIVQYTLPGQTVDYIHRIGRTARAGSQGQSLLFLLPSEVDYVKELNNHQLNLSQMDTSKILKSLLGHIKDFKAQQGTQSTRQLPRTQEEAATFLQDRFEELLRKDKELHIIAGKGFQSFIRAYSTYSKEVKAILKAKELHFGHVAKSFGLREAPSQVHGLSAKIRAEYALQQKNEKKFNSVKPLSFRQAALSEYSSGFEASSKKPPGFKRKRGKRT